MIGIAKVFNNEIQDLLRRPYLAIWILALSLTFLYVAANSNVYSTSIHVIVDTADDATPNATHVKDLVEEFNRLSVDEWPTQAPHSVVGLIRAKAELGILWEDL